jgi:hypothetical protein
MISAVVCDRKCFPAKTHGYQLNRCWECRGDLRSSSADLWIRHAVDRPDNLNASCVLDRSTSRSVHAVLRKEDYSGDRVRADPKYRWVRR